jgi:hypothetical protein
MKVAKITSVDYYRDGGSIGLSFDAGDGGHYEFFLKTRAFERPLALESHHPPVIYRGDVNDRDVVQELDWDEAKAFVSPLRFDNPCFDELVALVGRAGMKPLDKDLQRMLEAFASLDNAGPSKHEVLAFNARHGLDMDAFCQRLARLVAEEFAHGELAFLGGCAAMERLHTQAGRALQGFAAEMHRAFLAGQPGYRDPDDTRWQRHTLPVVMAALAREEQSIREP